MEELEQKALDFFKSGEYEKAAKLYVQLAVSRPDCVDYIITAANCYDRLGDKKVSLSLYKKAIEVNPQMLTALLNISLSYYEIKKYDKAEKYAKQALDVDANNYTALLNLGNIYYAIENFEDALLYYERVYELNPSYNVILGIAKCCYNLTQYVRAIEYAELAIEKRPMSIDGYVVAGNSYMELGEDVKAAEMLKKGAEIEPYSDFLCLSAMNFFHKTSNWKLCLHYAWRSMAIKGDQVTAEDHINLGYLLYEAQDEGSHEIVEKYLERWKEQYPENPIVQYISAALKNEQTVVTTDLSYLKGMFDSFASSFDEILSELDYQVPQLIASFLRDYKKSNLFKKRRILDLGCGTGLCAQELKACFSGDEFYGVDISDKMLEAAGEKNVYKVLYADDILNFLETNETVFNMVVAGDVLTYMGDLRSLFKLLVKTIKFNGLFCFSISKNIFDDSDYFLTSSGRFVHSLTYVRRLLKYCGFEIVRQEEHILRKEGAKDVVGYVILASKEVEVVFE